MSRKEMISITLAVASRSSIRYAHLPQQALKYPVPYITFQQDQHHGKNDDQVLHSKLIKGVAHNSSPQQAFQIGRQKSSPLSCRLQKVSLIEPVFDDFSTVCSLGRSM
jgi:hypothetical protein